MLIATETDVFVWDLARPEPIVASKDFRAMAEGATRRVIVLGGSILHDSGGQFKRLQCKIDQKVACILILTEAPLRALIGTEQAHLYEINLESDNVSLMRQFAQLSCRDDWHTPWGGPPAVRSLAASVDCLYADIHVGSIMRSLDGDTWDPVTPDLNEDIHQVATSPAAPKRVYANTANAVYVSEDRGESWIHRGAGLASRYGRAIAVHPNDPDHLMASVSDGPHVGNGQLYCSSDFGARWTHVTDGFPATTERNIDTFQVAFSADGTAWATIDDTLYKSDNRGKSWSVMWKAPVRIKQIVCGR